MDISKVKSKRVVCSEIGLYEFPEENKMAVAGGPPGEDALRPTPYALRLYPNPAKGTLRLKFNSPDERKSTIKFYDVVAGLCIKRYTKIKYRDE
ncbi:MAG: hypothetical protein ABIL15_05750 [candidate division WOR-3 bacterium]